MTRVQLFLFLAAFFTASAAFAAPVNWTLNSVTFSDGGTASGSFTFDAATTTYSNVNVTTTVGTVRGAATYTQIGGVYGGTAANQVGFLTASGAGIGMPNLDFKFASALTGAGGTIGIVTGLANSAEVDCANAGCTVPAGPNSRSVSAGSVTGVAASAPVPTLSEWAMVLMGAMFAAVAASTIGRRRAMCAAFGL